MYWGKYNGCPGFLPDCERDPAQWQPISAGEVLTLEAKDSDACVRLNGAHDLPLPNTKGARAPPFMA